MKLSELIAYVGDDNVEFQNLNNDAIDIKSVRQNGKITFATDPFKAQNLALSRLSDRQSLFVGLVVWLPRELLPSLNESDEVSR